MNYIVTGIGKSQDAIFKELLNRKFAVKKIDYSEVTDNSEDLFFVIYDGPKLNICKEFLNSHAINAIPIFVDIDRIMIPGLFKNGEESKRICIDCALSRMQEYYFPAKMHELIISLEDEFSDLYFLPEEISIFCNYLITYINSNLNNQIANFSFDYYKMIFKEISGYTNCPNCDNYDVNIEEMRTSLEGGKRYVSTNK
ncbi:MULTISPECIES: hypothetical protein [Lysinibacillus]|uniref:hypothetical protein n=1 Tax=Lysinibacillus TaxID=400634 RepID=UPI0002E7533D|nr:hypothetical protein [Lysinibacillus boronitolerans]